MLISMYTRNRRKKNICTDGGRRFCRKMSVILKIVVFYLNFKVTFLLSRPFTTHVQDIQIINFLKTHYNWDIIQNASLLWPNLNRLQLCINIVIKLWQFAPCSYLYLHKLVTPWTGSNLSKGLWCPWHIILS